MTITHIGTTIACLIILALCAYHLIPALITAIRVIRADVSDERPSYDIEYGCTVKDHELV